MVPHAPERRSAPIEVRARGRRLEGYAALFGVRARIGSTDEEIRQGAFAGALSSGRDVLALAERGDLGGMSFGFTVAPGGETRTGGVRVLEQLRLHEISVVKAWPAYQGTVVSARSLEGIRQLRLDHARRYLEALA